MSEEFTFRCRADLVRESGRGAKLVKLKPSANLHVEVWIRTTWWTGRLVEGEDRRTPYLVKWSGMDIVARGEAAVELQRAIDVYREARAESARLGGAGRWSRLRDRRGAR